MLENSDIDLSVEFEASNDYKLQWFRNNQPLISDENCEIITEDGQSTIHLKNVDKTKTGKYEVVLESCNNIIKSASTVKLTKSFQEDQILPPTFIQPLKPTNVHKGSVVLMDVIVKSQPAASFQWFIGTKDVSSIARESKLENIYITTRDNVSSICIDNINNKYEGIVTCRAENFGGSVACSANLNIIEEENVLGYAPEFVVPLRNTVVMDGEEIILNCIATGRPTPRINWNHDKMLLKKVRDIQFARQATGLCELKIKEAFPEMSGVYECTATNEFGSCVCDCTVTVEGRN